MNEKISEETVTFYKNLKDAGFGRQTARNIAFGSEIDTILSRSECFDLIAQTGPTEELPDDVRRSIQ